MSTYNYAPPPLRPLLLAVPATDSRIRLPTARIAAADQAAVGVATTTGAVATTIAHSRGMNTLGSHTLPNMLCRMGAPILQRMAIQLLSRSGLRSMAMLLHTTPTLMLLFRSLHRITIQTTLLNLIPRLSTPSRLLMPPLNLTPIKPPPPPNQPQWNSQGAPQAFGGGSRGRGGYGDRGGHKPSHGVPPVRHGHEYDAAPPPMISGFPQQYPLILELLIILRRSMLTQHLHPLLPPLATKIPHIASILVEGVVGIGTAATRVEAVIIPIIIMEPPDKPESPSAGKKKKRKTNTLGLTPGVDSETEDDEGEEKTLTELIGQEALNISDVAAFIAERKKKFPTRARVEAKKAAELAQREEDKAASLEKEADRLRKQLRRVEFSIKRKREQGDEGDEMRDPSEDSSDDEPEVMSSRTKTVLTPPPSANKADITRHCKYYSTGGTCGKKGKCRFVHDPQAREAAIKEREANNGRLTIQQRLILNDKEQEDLAVLQSIQYLRDKGLMNTAGASAAAQASGEEKRTLASISTPASASTPASTSAPASVSASTLPPSTSSLPAIPPQPAKREPPRRTNPPPSIIPTANSISAQGVRHYQGWLLKPYGSSSGKQSQSDDLP
ncbi:hypothetical protein TrVFT333_009114 [Trichoderma virens FT-333]|nr:hypothetical protein TrVFT333_009114 [Trichoderma virens FT-333]